MGWLYATRSNGVNEEIEGRERWGNRNPRLFARQAPSAEGREQNLSPPTTPSDCRLRSDVQTISPTQATSTSGCFCGSGGPLNGRSRGSGFVGGSSGGSGGVLEMGPTGESSLAGLNLTCMATSMCTGTFRALKGAYLLCPLLVRDPCRYSVGGNQKKHWFCWVEGMLRISIGAVIFISWVFGRSALFRPPK